MAGGGELLAVPRPGCGLVSVDIALGQGALGEPRGEEGSTSLVAATLDSGTSSASAQQLAARAEVLGGSLGVGAGWERLVPGVEGLAATLDELLELLIEVLADPLFPAAEVETAKARRLAELARRRSSPSALASVALARVMRGTRRERFPLIGLPSSVGVLDREQLVASYRRAAASAPLVVAVGDLDPQRLETLGERLLVAGIGGPAPTPPAAPSSHPDRRRVVVVDREHGSQTELRIGQAGLARLDPRRSTLLVLDALLGGAFVSRLNLELRERLALTYGARSSASSGRHDGTWSVAAGVETDRAGLAVTRTLEVLARLREEGPTEEEVVSARTWRLGTVPFALQSLSSLGARALDIGVFGLPEDDLAASLARLRAVDHQAVLSLARELLRPEDATIIAVGPAATLAPQLAALGEVEVVDPATLEDPAWS